MLCIFERLTYVPLAGQQLCQSPVLPSACCGYLLARASEHQIHRGGRGLPSNDVSGEAQHSSSLASLQFL